MAITYDPTPDLICEVSWDGEPTIDYYNSVINTTPTAYYRLGEPSGSAIDSSPNGLTGTYVGSPTLNAGGALTGDPNGAVLLNGTSQYVNIPATALIDSLVNSWSIEAWVYPTAALNSAADSGCAVVSRALGTTVPFTLAYGRVDGVGITDSRIWGGFYNGTAWKIVADTATATLNTYTHYVLTWNGTSLILYRNGLLVNTTIAGAADVANSTSLPTYIGRRWDSAGTVFFPGRIDEVSIYNTPVNSQRVASHFRNRAVPVTYTWTDISNDVIQVSTTRGRQEEIGVMETGTATIQLDNVSGRYDPGNALSPYYPNVVPLKQIRIRAGNPELTNPSFETDTSGWTAVSSTITRTTTQQHTGLASLQIATRGTLNVEGVRSDAVTVTSGDEVRANLYVFVPSGVLMQIGVEEYQSSTLLRTTVTNFTGTGDWQNVTSTVTTGASTDNVKLVVATQNGHILATTVYLDTVRFMRVYPLFRGYIEALPMSYEPLNYSTISMTANDGFEPLSHAALQATIPSSLSGTTINKLLDQADWPASLRNLDAGQSTIAPLALTSGNDLALGVIQDVAGSDLGVFFMSADGKATFQDRNKRTSAGFITAKASFSDINDGGLEYSDLQPVLDIGRIINDWQVAPDGDIVGAATQETTDETSIRKYFRRSEKLDTRLATNADALGQAQFLILRTAQPQLRLEALSFQPLATMSLWQAGFQREISDRIAVSKNPSAIATASAVSIQAYIEKVTWSISRDQPWTCSWQLSPADSTRLFILDNSSFGTLDGGNVLGY
jgi:hypothetical protein